ncbi:hypothetical protein [Pseudomonas putida]|uniref:Uncharacterized protein n=1 Tax=Pseudomonas putida TaxID=303 RepID=A0A8I1JIK0_PSEPU|nr:hypothetical protein [Pseudomonas putida]MBI6885082.1 hypothetical protein [Pseudomonas putida]
MSFNIPEYRKRSAYEIWHDIGNKSRTFQYFATQVTPDGRRDISNILHASGENTFEHSIMILPQPMGNTYGSGLETHVGFSLNLEHREDVFAIAEMFEELLSIAKSMEDEAYCGDRSARILKQGRLYAFETRITLSSLQAIVADEKGELVPQLSPIAKPHSNCFTIHVIVDGELVKLADFSLYAGIRSAYLVGHDLAVLRAILNGVPEEDIARMVPESIAYCSVSSKAATEIVERLMPKG